MAARYSHLRTSVTIDPVIFQYLTSFITYLCFQTRHTLPWLKTIYIQAIRKPRENGGKQIYAYHDLAPILDT